MPDDPAMNLIPENFQLLTGKLVPNGLETLSEGQLRALVRWM
jgi:hypothetical protein